MEPTIEQYGRGVLEQLPATGLDIGVVIATAFFLIAAGVAIWAALDHD